VGRQHDSAAMFRHDIRFRELRRRNAATTSVGDQRTAIPKIRR